jgi:hypothetical protein
VSSSLEYRRQVFFSSQHSAASCAAALSRRRSRRGSSPVAARGCRWLVRMSICHALPLTKRCVPPRFDVRSPADAEVAARPDHGAAPLLPCPAQARDGALTIERRRPAGGSSDVFGSGVRDRNPPICDFVQETESDLTLIASAGVRRVMVVANVWW